MDLVKPIKDTPKIDGKDAIAFRDALENDLFGKYSDNEKSKRNTENIHILESYNYFKSIATEGVF